MLKFNLLFVEFIYIYIENTGLSKAASGCFSPSPVILIVHSPLFIVGPGLLYPLNSKIKV